MSVAAVVGTIVVVGAACSGDGSAAEPTTAAHPTTSTIVATGTPSTATPSAGTTAGIGDVPTTVLGSQPGRAPTASDDISTEPTGTEPSQHPSPLAAYVGAGAVGSDDMGAAYERWQRVFQDDMAVCMGDEGFEYIPHVVPMQFTVVPGGAVLLESAGGARPGAELAPGDYAAQYGYGISTAAPNDGAARNPNDPIVTAMGTPERVAYFQAMYGASQSLDGNGYPNAEIAGDDGSCYAAAVAAAEALGNGDEIAPSARAEIDAAFAPLLEQLAMIHDLVATDPRVQAAVAAWSDCMAASGFPGYVDLNAPQSDVAARARGLMGDALDPINADPTQLGELQRFEIGVATADHACREAMGSVHQDVTVELEQRFVDEHRAELEEYRDALAALGG